MNEVAAIEGFKELGAGVLSSCLIDKIFIINLTIKHN